MSARDHLPPFTLEQFCRALAAQLLLVSYKEDMRSPLAPEIAENAANFILRFAQGEQVERPSSTERGP